MINRLEIGLDSAKVLPNMDLLIHFDCHDSTSQKRYDPINQLKRDQCPQHHYTQQQLQIQ